MNDLPAAEHVEHAGDDIAATRDQHRQRGDQQEAKQSATADPEAPQVGPSGQGAEGALGAPCSWQHAKVNGLDLEIC